MKVETTIIIFMLVPKSYDATNYRDLSNLAPNRRPTLFLREVGSGAFYFGDLFFEFDNFAVFGSGGGK